MAHEAKFHLPKAKCEKIITPKSEFDSRSFRWTQLKNGGAVLIGCPAGKWLASKARCAVGTRAHAIVLPANPSGRCKAGYRRAGKGYKGPASR